MVSGMELAIRAKLEKDFKAEISRLNDEVARLTRVCEEQKLLIDHMKIKEET